MEHRSLKPAFWGNAVGEVQNAAGFPLFKEVNLVWSKPALWRKGQKRPPISENEPFLYSLVWNHGNSRAKDHILYVGLTRSPNTRFGNHRTAKEIVDLRGSVGLTYAKVDFIRGRDKIRRIKQALEEVEHLIIWAVYQDLWNVRKLYTLPGMGKNRGNTWHIRNAGYRFSGRMPREIIYPWMLVNPGRNLTAKNRG